MWQQKQLMVNLIKPVKNITPEILDNIFSEIFLIRIFFSSQTNYLHIKLIKNNVPQILNYGDHHIFFYFILT